MVDILPFELQLLRDATLPEFVVVKTDIAPTVDDEGLFVLVELQVDELIERCAFGLIYALGALSFADGRARGVSGNWFKDDDSWTLTDMLERLTFANGRLHFYADYVRGRCLKTSIDLWSDGRVVVETVNRGEALTRWIDRLRGKKTLQAVG